MSLLMAVDAPWTQIVGDWIWGQSLAAVYVLVAVSALSRLKALRDPRLQSVLWGAVFVRLALPNLFSFSLDASALSPVSLRPGDLSSLEGLGSPLPSTSIPNLILPPTAQSIDWILMVWITVVLGLTVRWFFARRSYSQLLRASTRIEDEAITILCDRWRKAYGIKRRVRLVTHGVQLRPFTMGTLKPTIYIPRPLLLGPKSSLEAVLAHELAHVRALDDLKIVLQRTILHLFFFHPAVWWCGRKLDLCRELARDRDVLASRILCSKRYGHGIVDAVRVTAVHPIGMAALGRMFPQRIRALLRADEDSLRPPAWLGPLILATLLSIPVIAMAGPNQVEPADEPHQEIAWQSPLPNGRVSSAFGQRRNPFTKKMAHHTGTDIVDEDGAEILAPATGRVLQATEEPENPDWGTTLILEHRDGYKTLFAHLGTLKVSEGDWVEKGQVVATVGATGKVTGSHLHFEVWLDSEPMDSADLIDQLRVGQSP